MRGDPDSETGSRSSHSFRVLDGANEPRDMPHSIEAERNLISCCLVDGSETIGRCLQEKLSAKAFFLPAHGTIFEVMTEIFRTRGSVSIDVLVEELRTKRQLDSVGGIPGVVSIAGGVPTTAQAGYFIDKVREQWILRGILRAAAEMTEEVHSFTGGLPELLETKTAKLAKMLDFARSDQESSEKKAAAGKKRTLAKLAGQMDRSRWLHTGLPLFDKIFGPFDTREEDWLVIVGGSPSSGKSSWARQVAGHNLEQGKKGLVFLLETSVSKWLELGAAGAARVNARHLDILSDREKDRFTPELERWHGWINKSLWIYDEILPVELITARIEDHVRRFGRPDFIVIDHMHLLRSQLKFRAREPEMGHIAKELKKCLKRVDVTGFVLAQLNRAPKADDRRPSSSDLRDSGEIEQAADNVILIHTPPKDRREAPQDKNQLRVMVELVKDKSRNGETGWREFWFDRNYTTFSCLNDERDSGSSFRSDGPAPTKREFRG